MLGRKKPFTVKEIAKKRCARCCEKAKFQWSVCALNNNYIPICVPCDVELNRIVLEFVYKHRKSKQWIKYINKYANEKLGYVTKPKLKEPT